MKIGVVGSINVDMCVSAERIPKKGETVSGSGISYKSGGKGANQAVAAARLGADVTMFGIVGNDAYGVDILSKLKAEGVKTDNIQVCDGITTGLAVITLGEKDNTIVVIGGANNLVDTAYADSIKSDLAKCDYVLLQNEIPEQAVEYVLDFCFENNIKTILNPAPVRKIRSDYIEKIDYLTPNEHEAEILFGSGGSLSEILRKYPEKLIITQGSRGVSFCGKSGEIVNIAPIKADVKDTTGAGDTLNGAFATALSMGKSVYEALVFANTAAGISTEKDGAQGGMPTIEEVYKRM